MKSFVISLLTLMMVCSVINVSADESSLVNDELQDLRTRVKQLEETVRKLKSNNHSFTTQKSISLAIAVERFNARAAASPIGRTQQALTVAEVIAAIRWIQPDAVPVTSEEFAAYKKIAETQKLPPEADLEVISTFIPDNKTKFQAWSIRLRMPRTARQGWTYAFPIRQRWISSAPLTDRDSELKQLPGSTIERILDSSTEKSLKLP